MVGLGDATPVGTQAETVVYFAHKTRADQAAAQAVARSMSGAVITALGPTTDGAQVTVVTGTQFTVNPPVRRPPPRPRRPRRRPPPSASTATTAPSTGAFQPPTPAVTPAAAVGPPVVHRRPVAPATDRPESSLVRAEFRETARSAAPTPYSEVNGTVPF